MSPPNPSGRWRRQLPTGNIGPDGQKTSAGTQPAPTAYDSKSRGAQGGIEMYRWLHWTGIATVAIWIACSAYFTLHGI
jgi:hypothetical protein